MQNYSFFLKFQNCIVLSISTRTVRIHAPYYQLKVSDITVILDIPVDVLRSDIADRSTDLSKAYRRGKSASKIKHLSQEMMLAQVGSPLAIENAHRNLLDMEGDG